MGICALKQGDSLPLAEVKKSFDEGLLEGSDVVMWNDFKAAYLDNILSFVTLTSSAMMQPHASVSGLMISLPQAHYFSVGKIGPDQLANYALRRNLPPEEVRRYLQGLTL